MLDKLHKQTAKINWHELQLLFAKGNVLKLTRSLDLIEIAVYFANDQTDKLIPLFDSKQIVAPSNDQARAWYDSNTELWCVVIAPFVLVQEQNQSQGLSENNSDNSASKNKQSNAI